MKKKLIQWNINGFYNRFEELYFLVKEHYQQIVSTTITNRFTCGRVVDHSIMTNQNLPSEGIPFHAQLRAIVVSVTLPHLIITIYNITMYIYQITKFYLQDKEQIIWQILNTFKLVEDFVRHNET